MKTPGFIFIFSLIAALSKAQPGNCILKPPQIIIDFGTGDAGDVNTGDLLNYQRVPFACPPDGYYAIVPSTGECFHGDWHALTEDHTPGDHDGNMLLVNAAYGGGVFLRTPINGLKSNTVYELGLWLMNLCRPTKKCPSLLLPHLNIRLETPDGNAVAKIATGDVPRVELPWWTQHRAYFTTPPSTSTLLLVMSDNAPGGCGNDFALDDITFRECVPQTREVTKEPTLSRPPPKKITTPLKKKAPVAQVIKPTTDSTSAAIPVVRQNRKIVSAIPLVLKTRENPLVRRIETDPGEIKIEVYDNGEIDGDSVSIYHNNTLIKSHMLLSREPISFSIAVDPFQPHHEIIMVADNLGSIPPNTSVMIITTATNRYEVFISTNEQKNAKVIFDLKK